MHDPLIWLVASVATYALGTNLLWLSRAHPGRGRRYSRGLQVWAKPIFYLGIPALAIAQRIVASRDLGLPERVGDGWTDGGGLPWPKDLLLSLGLAGLAALLAAGGRLWRARAWSQPSPLVWRRLSWGELAGLVEHCLFHELHWAFYRACLLGSGLAGHGLAVYVSLLVLGLEAWTSPAFRQRWTRPDRAERASQTSVLAALSAQIFLITGSSLWAFGGQLVSSIGLAAASLEAPKAYPSPEASTASEAAQASTRSPVIEPDIEPTIV